MEEGRGEAAFLLAEEGKGGGKMPSSLTSLKDKPLIKCKAHFIIQLGGGGGGVRGRTLCQTGHQELDLLMFLWTKVCLSSTKKGTGAGDTE